jgi:transposase InsO family protein
VGPPQDRGNGPPCRSPGDCIDGAADPRRRGLAAEGRLPARTAPARGRTQSCVHHAADRTEPGLAAGLLRVRDPTGGTWRVAGVADYWSKVEFGWHWPPTANQYDAIAAVQLALAEGQRLLGIPAGRARTDQDTGEIVPITLVTDNGGPFRSFRFGAFVARRPELRHVRTRVKSPGQNGVWERAFELLKYERLYRETIADPLDLAREAEAFRVEFDTIRPHTRLSPGTAPTTFTCASPTRRSATFPSPKPCQLLDAGERPPGAVMRVNGWCW